MSSVSGFNYYRYPVMGSPAPVKKGSASGIPMGTAKPTAFTKSEGGFTGSDANLSALISQILSMVLTLVSPLKGGIPRRGAVKIPPSFVEDAKKPMQNEMTTTGGPGVSKTTAEDQPNTQGSGMQSPVDAPKVDDIKLDLPAQRPAIDRSIVPPGGLNAKNIDGYAQVLSKKFGFPKSFILAQVKKESGPDFTDLAHRGDTERGHDQGGPSVGPNQITEGVLLGGIWNGGEDGIDLSPEEAEKNPALAMQAGLIHLYDYTKQEKGNFRAALGRYVGHDQATYIADIEKYMGQLLS